MIELKWNELENYIADPIEYRFVDEIRVGENKAFGRKMVSSQDWYFKMHFPGNPVMPGVFVMEALMQTGVFIITTRNLYSEKLMMFHACNSMRMYGEVRPGSVLDTEVTLTSWRGGIAKYEGKAFVENRKICEMNFTLIMPSELKKITPRK